MGEVLRRLTSKCLASASRRSAITTLTPLQLGVGVKGGCEVVIHATNLLLSSSSSNQSWCLFVDFTNAFNCISREAMFVEIRRHIPPLAAWMESCYSCQPLLYLGNDSLRSCCGVQQGDPLGPLGFALTLQPLIEKLKASVAGLGLNVWYLDDGTLMGSPDDLAVALQILERDGPPLGLHLNRGKSLLFIPEDADADQSPLPPDIPITRHGFSLLGCPVGPPDYCEEIFQARIEKVKVSLGALQDLEDAQLEYTLLRSCLSLPKVSFVLRACPPSHILNAAKDFDFAMRRALESILGRPMSDWAWLKATLPCCLGGLNLRSASLHALLHSWPPVLRPNAGLSVFLGVLQPLPPIPCLQWLLWPLQPLGQIGSDQRTSTSPCGSFLCHKPLITHHTAYWFHLPPPSAPGLWHCLPVCHMLETG